MPLKRVSLGAAVLELRSMLETVLGDRIELVVDVSASTSDVMVDPDQLDQVLLHFAINAVDATPHRGRVVVTVADLPTSDGPANYVALTFADEGVGMSAEARERVFDEFATPRPASTATGLGLAYGHRFAKNSGGCLSLRSTPGEGTTVVLYLPSAPGGGSAARSS
jgi:signal transduction histidine kinase